MAEKWYVALAFIAGPLCGSAQAADAVSLWTGADMKAMAGKLQPEAARKKIAGQTLATFSGGSCSVWLRTDSGQAELHKTKTDLIVVEQGEATLLTGGSIPDAKMSAPNEVRGSSIQGGVSRKVFPGDVIRIAAGTPHQFLLSPGEVFLYLAVKIPGTAPSPR